MKIKIIPLLLAIIFTGCNKPAERSCLKSNGQMTTQTVNFQKSFSEISLLDDLNLILVQDSINFLEIVGPENLIQLIGMDSSNTELTLSNHNKCNFLREKKQINLYYHYSSLNEIHLFGYGLLTNTNEINHPISIYTDQAFSSINLTLNNTNTSLYISRGSTDVNLNGNTTNLYCYSSGLAPVKAKNLQTNKAHINSNSINTFEVSVSDSLTIELNNYGDVYYHGNPSYTKFTVTGEGEIFNI